MPTNTCLYITLSSFLIGVFLTFFGHTKFGDADKLIKLNQVGVLKVRDKEKSLGEKRDDLQKKQLQRRDLQSKIREYASKIEGEKSVAQSLKDLEGFYKESIDRQDVKYDVNQKGLSSMQDQLSDDLALIERTLENMDKKFKLEKERLSDREKVLAIEADELGREVTKKKSELTTEIERIKNNLQRVNNLNPNKITEPWEVGDVIEYVPSNGRVVINAGAAKGIKPNFKFMVFTAESGKERIYKGMMIVKEVNDLISVAVMESKLDFQAAPVKGDKFGSLIFRDEKLNFYLAGDFRSKYSKSSMENYLLYLGNNVVSELTSEVDFFIQASLAEPEVPTATSLGVTIIGEDSIAPFVGDF